MTTTPVWGMQQHPLLREYFMNTAFDEMFDGDGAIRPHYAALFHELTTLPPEEIGGGSSRRTRHS